MTNDRFQNRIKAERTLNSNEQTVVFQPSLIMVRLLYLLPLVATGLQAFASPVVREVSAAAGPLTVDEAYDAVIKLQRETHAAYSDIRKYRLSISLPDF